MSDEYFLTSEDKIQPAQLKKLEKCSAGRYSLVGSDVAWKLRGTAIDPRVRHFFSRRFGHENITTTILPLPLIQGEHLSVNGEKMCT